MSCFKHPHTAAVGIAAPGGLWLGGLAPGSVAIGGLPLAAVCASRNGLSAYAR